MEAPCQAPKHVVRRLIDEVMNNGDLNVSMLTALGRHAGGSSRS